MARKRARPAEPTVTFWGATRTVTGSMHQVDAGGQTLLLDCGLFQGPRAESRARNAGFPFRPRDIAAVLLSHAHIVRSGGLRLTLPGALGRPGLPILGDPAPVPPAELLISESTYGGHTHEPVEETAERLGGVVRRTAERGGKVIIPAFSVGRTQTILYFLHQLRAASRLPEVPVFVDSPMALRPTEVF